LHPETVEALRAALDEQRRSGTEPTAPLIAAIHAAAKECRERRLPAETLIIQLKALADDIGMPAIAAERNHPRAVREWMVAACLRAYWESEGSSSDS
jgi:hypothetical protein